MTDPKFSESVLDIRVYYEDTDAGGVVFYANYLKFLERARTEWLRGLGVNQSDLAEREHRLFVVHSLDMSYRKPARLDDLITIRSRITRIGRASIHFAQRAERNGELLAEGNIQICCVDSLRMRPAELPDNIRAKLKFIQIQE
ncbi:tol-pal system-associated acyl-CoA thioesterase [Bordetella bronchiseptica]|uniref:Tol-pal system-associated acyl-CoA thioesterase n=1 Tax=Bordetella genomosp. 6 TaxID=463024 RepID=A0ABX4FFU5_9BORD|nr:MULTISPECIES: tol-pal system-associated acyl-CoA thioesterase [Bordetella]KCV63245.1 tol-pal system-associated acyl-CoA thioesterase [Bordetella bronchiseptica 99-R-0433]OZI80798.1 tol-pal system-associated acyl-CoA thioesterase [Bordetella genomosp. 6]